MNQVYILMEKEKFGDTTIINAYLFEKEADAECERLNDQNDHPILKTYVVEPCDVL